MGNTNTLITAAEPVISWLNKCNIDVLADIADTRNLSYKIEDGKIIEVHKE